MRKGWMQFQNKRKHGKLPTLVIGNITVGGTGKTPLILFLCELFNDRKLAVLSRGYGRKSQGYIEVETHSSSKNVGDEPLEVKRTLTASGMPVKVVVGENRLMAINQIAQENNQIEFVLLDDGLQHVNLIPDVSVVLTTFEKPFNRELFSLPFGSLREFAVSAKQYDLLVVTKCPTNLSSVEIEQWWKKNTSGLPFSRENVFFAEYSIDLELLNSIEINAEEHQGKNRGGCFDDSEDSVKNQPADIISREDLNKDSVKSNSLIEKGESGLLITGIVNTDGIEEHLKTSGFVLGKHFKYSDHYYFGEKELKEWLKYSLENEVNYWFTTRKDWQRLQDILSECKEIFPMNFSLKIGIVYTKVHILEGRTEEFKNKIIHKLKENKR